MTTDNPVLAEFWGDPFIPDIAERAASYLEVNLTDMSPEASAWHWTPAQIAEARPVLADLAGSKFPAATAVLAALTAAHVAVEAFEFPALAEAEVTDDGETYQALRCPWCGAVLTGEEDIAAVDQAERWTRSDWIGDEDFQRHQLPISFDDRGEFGDTLYYKTECCEKPVSLPEGWTVRTP